MFILLCCPRSIVTKIDDESRHLNVLTFPFFLFLSLIYFAVVVLQVVRHRLTHSKSCPFFAELQCSVLYPEGVAISQHPESQKHTEHVHRLLI